MRANGYVARETALAPLDYGGDGTLPDMSVTFDDVQLSSRQPLRFGFSFSQSNPQHDP